MRYLDLYIRSIRLANIVITVLALFITLNLSEISISLVKVFEIIAVTLTIAAGNIINDYFDIDTDRINRPERVIASGKYGNKEVLSLYFLSLAMIIPLLFYLSYIKIVELILVNVLLFLYSWRLKRFQLIPNLIIAFLTAYLFLYITDLSLNSISLFLFAAAFITNFSREIVKDYEDREGDLNSGYRSFAVKYRTTSKNLIRVLLVLIITISYLYFRISLPFYLILGFTLYLLYLDPFKKSSQYQYLLKLLMLLGLISPFLA